MGFETPTEIQAQAIPLIMQGLDIIGQASTGTGKTAAFAIPAIEKIDPVNPDLQVLVMCPTRELVVQVTDQFKQMMRMQKSFTVVSIYGGQNISIQLRALQKNPQVVVGTPGRIMDHMRRKTLDFSKLSMVILDEADQMLDMGFREDMEIILKATPEARQTVMFSATINATLGKLMRKYQNSPQHIDITANREQNTQINQMYFEINNKSKFEAFKRLISFYKIKSALIFCNTKAKVDDLAKLFSEKGLPAIGLHGDMKQNKRDQAMRGFREERIRFLIATDVAARGIDVENIEAVFNYDIPRFGQDYVHRIGRTGRAGKTGYAFSFINGTEKSQIIKIARMNNMTITPGAVPMINELESSIVTDLKQKIEASVGKESSLEQYAAYAKQLGLEQYDQEKVIAILLRIILKEDTANFNHSTDFSVKHEPRQERGGLNGRGYERRHAERNKNSERKEGGGGRGGYAGRSSEGRSSSGERSSYAGRKPEGKSSSGERSSYAGRKPESRSSSGERSSYAGRKPESRSSSGERSSYAGRKPEGKFSGGKNFKSRPKSGRS